MTSLLTPEGVLSYPKLFKAELPKDARPDDKPKFSAAILLTKAATETVEYKALVAAALKCARDKWGPDADAMIRDGKLRMPFRKDVKDKGYDPDEYVVFINMNAPEDANKPKPQIIGRDGKPITDAREIFPGVRARLSCGVFAYETRGNKGVSFGLRNVQKLGDGKRLDSFQNAKDEFGTLADEAPSDLADDLAGFVS